MRAMSNLIGGAVLASAITAGIIGGAIGYGSADCATPVEPVAVTERSVYHAPSIYTDGDIEVLAKMLYGEARGCEPINQAAAVWCVLNRVDSPEFSDTIYEVVTAPNQFHGYDPDNPVWPELEDMTVDVLERWTAEKLGCKDTGRVLPAEYVYFYGAGIENRFQSEYQSREVWEWSLPSPYEED